MRPRRGYALMECVIALGIMAMVLSVALRLIYASDVALGRERTASSGAGAMAAMMSRSDIPTLSSASIAVEGGRKSRASTRSSPCCSIFRGWG